MVETIYRVEERTGEAWLGELVASARRMLDDGFGVTAYTFRMDLGGLRVLDAVQDFPMVELGGKLSDMDPEFILQTHAGPPIATASEGVGRRTMRQFTAIAATLGSDGMRDCLGILGKEPDGWGIGIAAPLGAIQRPAHGQRQRWSRVAGHLQAAHRLLRRVGNTRERSIGGGVAASDGRRIEWFDVTATHGNAPVEAVLDPSGRLLDARNDAREKGTRYALRDAAMAVDRTRARMLRGAGDDDALDAWKELVDCRWSLLDRFDSDGRRFFVARRNEPGATPNPLLDVCERVVLGYRAAGHPLKLIAYEMGFSVSWTSRELRSAMGKLGLRSIGELGAFRAPNAHASLSRRLRPD